MQSRASRRYRDVPPTVVQNAHDRKQRTLEPPVLRCRAVASYAPLRAEGSASVPAVACAFCAASLAEVCASQSLCTIPLFCPAGRAMSRKSPIDRSRERGSIVIQRMFKRTDGKGKRIFSIIETCQIAVVFALFLEPEDICEELRKIAEAMAESYRS